MWEWQTPHLGHIVLERPPVSLQEAGISGMQTVQERAETEQPKEVCFKPKPKFQMKYAIKMRWKPEIGWASENVAFQKLETL